MSQFNHELLPDSNRHRNEKATGTKQVVRCAKRGHTRRSEAAVKAATMHAVAAQRIDRATQQRDRRKQKRELARQA